MFKLTLLLSAAIFLVLLIGGEDRGQLRPGLAAAIQTPAEERPAAPAEVVAAPADQVEPADIAPATAPVIVADAAPAAPLPAPVVPEAEAEAEVFSLATFAETAPETAGDTALDAPAAAEVLAAEPATETAAPAGSEGPVAIVDAQSVNVRSGPGTDFAVLTRLAQGEQVTLIGDAGEGWALIRIEGDGVEGYVSTRYISAR